MRTSTVPKAWCGRTLHQSCVASTIESVSSSSADEVRVCAPVAERLVNAAAREGAGEDLGAHRVQSGVAVVEKGRVGREREQWRQQLPHPIRDGDGAIGPVDADVDVQAPGVVPLGDPAQVLLEPAVVLGVDDVLVEVVGPRVGAHRAPGRAPARRRSRTAAPACARCRSAASAKVSPRPERISISVSISSPLTAGASWASRRQAACISSKRCSRSRIAGSRIANSSSIPIVKSVEASKISRTASRSSASCCGSGSVGTRGSVSQVR